jgi:O-antigen ligase
MQCLPVHSLRGLLLEFHAIDATLAHFTHNEYLQVAADSGLAALALLFLGLLGGWAASLAARAVPSDQNTW